jgi:tripartite ATP-independent transporter DctP family solute receptor
MGHVTRRSFIIRTAGAASSLFAINILTRPADAAEFSYKYGNNVPVTHPINIAAQKAADRIRDESGGRLEIRLFPNNQLGGDTDMLSQVRSGALEFYTLSALVLSNLVPAAAISGIGFAFADFATLWKAMDGDLGAHIRAQCEKVGLVPMEKVWDNGFRQITSSTKPINTPEDLAGLKIRVPVSPIWTSLFTAFGATPVSMNFAELYTALQTKVVEAQENPLSLIKISKLYEVQKYCALSSHMWDGFWFVANKNTWGALPEDLREIAAKNLNIAAEEQRQMLAALATSAEADLKKEGMVFTTPDRAAFVALLIKNGFYKQWRDKFGPDAWKILTQYSNQLP